MVQCSPVLECDSCSQVVTWFVLQICCYDPRHARLPPAGSDPGAGALYRAGGETGDPGKGALYRAGGAVIH